MNFFKYSFFTMVFVSSIYAEKTNVVTVCADKKTVESVFETAKKDNKLVVIDFFAEWCGPCKMMAPTFARLAEDMQDSCIFAKIDVDQCKEVAKEYKIQAMPTIVVLRDTTELGRIVGSKTYATLKEQIESYNKSDAKKADATSSAVAVDTTELSEQLFEAISLCDVDKVTTLIKKGADLNAPFYNQLTPLVMALIAGTQQDGNKAFSVVNALLDAGAAWDEDVIPGKKTTIASFLQEMKQGYEKVIENCDFVIAGLEKRASKK